MNAYLAAYLAHARAHDAWRAESARHLKMKRADQANRHLRALLRAKAALTS